MADKPKRDVDEDLVRQLAKLLDETGLTEIEYGRDGWHIRVSGGSHQFAPLPRHPPPALEPSPSPIRLTR